MIANYSALVALCCSMSDAEFSIAAESLSEDYSVMFNWIF